MTNTTMNNGANNNGVNGGMNMINTTEFNNVLTGLNKEEVKEVTNAKFMDKMVKDYGTSLCKDENIGVGQVTILSNTFTAINLMDDAQFKPLARKALEVVLGEDQGFDQGVGEYHGLFVEEILADKTDMDFVTVSAEQENLIIAEMISCDLNDVKNLRKIFADINDLFRMYQELIIDAAKKLYVVAVTFNTNMLKANSTIAMEHNFKSFKDFKGLDIVRANRFAAPKETAVGEVVEFKNDKGQIVKYSFRDTISVIQDTVADQFVQLVSTEGKAKYDTIMPNEETIASFGLGSEFSTFVSDMYTAIRTPYSKLTAWKSEEISKVHEALANKKVSRYAASKRIDEVNKIYDEAIAELSNTARWYTKDLDMAVAGKVMYMISNIKRENKTWVIDTESTNQVFLAVAPELFSAYLIESQAEMKICGYRVLGNTEELVEGQTLTFVNGNAVEVENVYVDSTYSGELTVQTVDGVLSVVKKIEIKRVEATEPSEIVLNIYENSVIDALHFARTNERVLTKNFGTLEAQKVFEKAEKVTAVPFYTYKDNNGKTKHVYNAIVATIPSLSDPSVKFEIPVASYTCNSAAYELIIAGVTATEVVSQANGQNMRLKFTNYSFEEVELNKAKEVSENMDIDNINNDPFAASVVVENKEFTPEYENAFEDKTPVKTVSSLEDEAFSTNSGNFAEEFDGADYSNYGMNDDFSNFDFSEFEA